MTKKNKTIMTAALAGAAAVTALVALPLWLCIAHSWWWSLIWVFAAAAIATLLVLAAEVSHAEEGDRR